MREKFAVAREGHRQLASFIKENPGMTWFDIAVVRQVSLSTVCRVARQFDLQRPLAVRKLLYSGNVQPASHSHKDMAYAT